VFFFFQQFSPGDEEKSDPVALVRLIAVLLKNKQAVYVAHQSGLDITKHYDDVTGLALKALAEGLGDADELLDAFFTSLHLDAPEEEVRKALAARAWAYAFACEGDEAVWQSALDGAAIALPDACKATYYYRCASRQAWSGPVCKSNLQSDFNVRVFECFDKSTSAVLRELAESNRFVQKSAESTSI
jgi:hypothetical protein